MKKKIFPILIAIGILIIIIAGIAVRSLVVKYSPSKVRADLSTYYNLSADNDVAIVLNNELIDTKASLIDGKVYVDYDFLHDTLNERFYWDEYENILLYATYSDLVSANAESADYTVGKNRETFDSIIVKATSESALVNLDFALSYTKMTYTYYENPSRIVVYNDFSKYQTATVKKATVIRATGGIKGDILDDLEKNESLTVLEKYENWSKVMTEDGIIGYIKNKRLSDPVNATRKCDFTEEEEIHTFVDGKISLVWHQTTSAITNTNIAAILADIKGVNTISPTWFYLNDNKGNLNCIASLDYVNYCHSQDISVWALFSNLENSDVDTVSVLSHTSTRQNLVNQIVSYAIKYDLDGVNIDFEALSPSDTGDSYIEFIRELSIKLKANDIVLSVDNYVPTEYTSFYNRAEQAKYADYVIMMGYDEHYAGSDAGSVASLSWVKEGITNTLKEVPSNQTILAMPFYTRVWCLTYTSDSESDNEPDDSNQDDTEDEEPDYETTSSALGMTAANRLIETNGAEKTWLEDAGQYYAEYENGGNTYKIWLEDNSSLDEKLRLIDSNSLAGGAFWKLGFEANDTWDTVIKYLN